jgi:glycosyltransferase involved in cell wall biosynthesis
MDCRILYLIGQLHSGGSERQLFYLLREIDRSRYRPAVAVWNFSEKDTYLAKIRDLGVPVYSFQSTVSARAKLLALRRMVKELGPTIVHSYSFYLNFAAHWSVRETPVTAIGSMRSALQLDKQINGWILSKLSACLPHKQIYNSFAAARFAANSKSYFTPRHLYVVQNGVDLLIFRPSHLSPARPANILGVGSLVEVKRWDRLLAAAEELNRRNFDFSLHIVGDGPLRGSLEQVAQDRGISDRFDLRGYSDDIASLLSNATFLVLSSDAEGCPNVIMEAMACGRAVVTTDVGDAPRLVEDGTTGFVVPCGDDAMLVERMATLLNDYELCKRMGEAGRAKAEREFGLDRMVENTLAVYRAVGAIETISTLVPQLYWQNSEKE